MNQLMNSPLFIGILSIICAAVTAMVVVFIQHFLAKNSPSFKMFQTELDKKVDKKSFEVFELALSNQAVSLKTSLAEKANTETVNEIKSSFKAFKGRFGAELENIHTGLHEYITGLSHSIEKFQNKTDEEKEIIKDAINRIEKCLIWQIQKDSDPNARVFLTDLVK